MEPKYSIGDLYLGSFPVDVTVDREIRVILVNSNEKIVYGFQSKDKDRLSLQAVLDDWNLIDKASGITEDDCFWWKFESNLKSSEIAVGVKAICLAIKKEIYG